MIGPEVEQNFYLFLLASQFDIAYSNAVHCFYDEYK
jgi:hypothetical protein